MKKKMQGLSVEVYHNNFDKAFRQFKKKVQKEGVVQEIRDRQTFTKPSDKRRLAKKAAVRAARKNHQQSIPKRLY